MSTHKPSDVKKFLEGKGHSLEVGTVGELIEALGSLPLDFKIEHGFNKGVSLTLCNLKLSNPHLIFEECDE